MTRHRIIASLAALAVLSFSPAMADPLGSVTGGSRGTQSELTGCTYNSSPPTLTTGQQVATQCDSSGNVKVTGSISATNPSVGTIGAAAPTSGTLIAVTNSGNLVALTADGSSNLNVNCTTGCSGSGSSFGAAFPATGSAIGVKNGANMVNLTADASSNLNVNVAASSGTNLSTNVAQVAGTTTATGNGVTGAGSQRVTIASDNSAFTVNVGTIAATNISTNEAQINGVAPSMGNGTSGTGVQRVTIASDSTGQVALTAGTTVGLAAGSNVVGVVGNAQSTATAGLSGPLVQGSVTTGAPSYTNGNTNPLSLNTSGALRITLFDATANAGALVNQPGASDASNVSATNMLYTGGVPLMYNGSTWDRQRAVVNATNSTGTGIAAAGLVGQLDDTSPTAITENQFGNVRIGASRQVLTEELSQYPYSAVNGAQFTPETASSGNVANANAVATLATAVGKTTYITGFQCTPGGSTGAALVTATVAGVITGTMSYTMGTPAGVAVMGTPLVVSFNPAVPASAANTTIVVTMPALGAGNTNASCSAQGYLG